MKRRNLAKVNLSDPTNPKLDLVSKKAFLADLKDFKDGQRVWIEVQSYYRQRTASQNALLHAYLQEIADETGNEMEQIKDVMKKKFLTTIMTDKDGETICNPVTGEVMEYVKDTSALSTVEMMDFCDKIRVFAMDWGIYLEAPDEQRELKFK